MRVVVVVDLAAEYGLSEPNVRELLRGNTYADAGGPIVAPRVNRVARPPRHRRGDIWP